MTSVYDFTVYPSHVLRNHKNRLTRTDSKGEFFFLDQLTRLLFFGIFLHENATI